MAIFRNSRTVRKPPLANPPGRKSKGMVSSAEQFDWEAILSAIRALIEQQPAVQITLRSSDGSVTINGAAGMTGNVFDLTNGGGSGSYYDILSEFGTDKTQREKLNFSYEFTLTDDAGGNATFAEHRWKTFIESTNVILTSSWTHCRMDATLAPGNYNTTLPPSADHLGRMVNVVKIDNSVNTVTVITQGGDTLNIPAGTDVLTLQWDHLCVIAVSGGWEIVSHS